ncbi:unnamed protein product [Rangifer tarandus platyrhynchus]|uniref:Uncharacterized protein n=1 Tax=Rangifer tarandus platyrhynchus TaxID=3082113 RepID=A0AC59Y4W3_RANTA
MNTIQLWGQDRNRRPELNRVEEGAQHHVIILSTDPGQESCPPREHRVLEFSSTTLVAITQLGPKSDESVVVNPAQDRQGRSGL